MTPAEREIADSLLSAIKDGYALAAIMARAMALRIELGLLPGMDAPTALRDFADMLERARTEDPSQ